MKNVTLLFFFIGLPFLLFSQTLDEERILELEKKHQEKQEKKELEWFQKKREKGEVKVYKLKAGNKKIAFLLDFKKLDIEAHNSNEIVIEAAGVKPPNKRAQGLMPVYNAELDNTGVGLSMKDVDGVITFKHGANQRGVRYKIKVPKNNPLAIKTGWNNRNVNITGVSGEIEIDLQGGSMKLIDVEGPVIAHTISGNIETVFSKLSSKGPSSLSSVSGFVDVTLPKKAKVELSLKSVTGQIYVANSKLFKTPKDNKKMDTDFFPGMPQELKGQMNGGGVSFSIETVSNDIYLREK